jgi:hypothetical protein
LQKKQQMHNHLSYRKIDVSIAAFYLKPRTSRVNARIRARAYILGSHDEIQTFWHAGFGINTALLHKSAAGRTTPIPRRTYPMRTVCGVPNAVKRFRIAAQI